MNQQNHFALGLITFSIFLFLLGPLAIIFVASFEPTSVLQFPPTGFSLEWYQNIFTVSAFMDTFKLSMFVSLLGNLCALLLGIPAAYALSRFDFRGKGILNAIFVSPILIPGTVLGFTFLRYLIVSYSLPLEAALFIGHTIMLPFIIRVIASSMANFDFSIEEAAMNLGSSRIGAFFRVIIPNIKSGIIAGVLIAFLESFNNVDISVFLTGPGLSTLPIQMLTYVEHYFDPTVAAISVLLMIFTAVFMFLIERLVGLSHFTKR
ncbi:LOW QUALITY PROTEIN: spermidine putrescine ABC transporter permease component PotC [Bacillus sp. JCM 19047]|nr:LOW QUALITY PROTEIN: spermidine putrescine ABC transporter permease component PotC [Bacillus sp. JCM 19047]